MAKNSTSWNFDYPTIAKESGFTLQEPDNNSALDWRSIGSIDTDRLLSQQNFDKLDSIIDHLAEAPLIKTLIESNILENGIIKYFVLSQYSIQFLIFCKKFLDETVQSLRETIFQLQSENLRLSKIESESNNEIIQLHKEIQQLKQINEIIFPCSLCSKNFISNEMLNIHISRKHADDNQMRNDKNLISTIKLELEIKHLKERLNDAEKEIRKRKSSVNVNNEEQLPSSSVSYKDSAERDSNLEIKDVAVQSNENLTFREIGIQSNLVEDKEKNESSSPIPAEILITQESLKLVQSETGKIYNICNKLQEKIDILEKTNERFSSSENLLEKFDEKLQNIEKVFEEKSQKDVELFNEFAKKINSGSTQSLLCDNEENIKNYFEISINKLQKDNLEKLNQCIEKIDLNCEEKLKLLRKEIENLSKNQSKENLSSFRLSNEFGQNSTRSETRNNRIFEQNSGRSETRSNTIMVRPKSSTESLGLQLKSIADIDLQHSENEGLHEASSSDSDVVIDGNHSTKIKPESAAGISSIVTLKDSGKKKAGGMLKSRLKSLGISGKKSSLSNYVMENVTEKLNEKQKELKHKIPNYYVTRNRIRKIVNKMCTQKDMKPESNAAETPLSSPGLETTSKTIHTAQVHQPDEESNSTRGSPKNISGISQKVFENDNDEFKKKLERILSSPIRKVSKTQLLESSHIEDKSDNYTIKSFEDESLKEPIPAPRKKVMFNISTLEETYDVEEDDTDTSLAIEMEKKTKLKNSSPYDIYGYESSDNINYNF